MTAVLLLLVLSHRSSLSKAALVSLHFFVVVAFTVSSRHHQADSTVDKQREVGNPAYTREATTGWRAKPALLPLRTWDD